MRIKTVFLSIALSILPIAGFAGCNDGHDTAQSCMDGFKWDPAMGTCVETVTG